VSKDLSSTDLDDLITQSDAARLRGCSRQAIANLVEKGRLRTLEIAGIKLVSRKEIVAFETLPPGRKAKVK
jgi:predicted DNA-binding protein (UPF0251 family)